MFFTSSRAGRILPGALVIIVTLIPVSHPFCNVPRHMRKSEWAPPAFFESMPNAHSIEATGHCHQRDGFTDLHASIIVCNIDKRLHVPPRIPVPIGPPCRLLPLSLCWKPFPCLLAIRGCKFPSHPNSRPISNRRRCLMSTEAPVSSIPETSGRSPV